MKETPVNNIVVKVCFPLFGAGGVVNPVRSFRGSHILDERGVWCLKQASSFDGGWRWFQPSCGQVTTIYNTKLHPKAFADISDIEFVDSLLDAEFVLKCAQGRVLVDHNAFNATEFVLAELRMFTDHQILEMKQ